MRVILSTAKVRARRVILSTAKDMLLPLLLFPALVHAQLRGVVRDGPTRAPLSGAVVTVLDRAGATTARAITDVDGRFTVGLAPSAVSLRVVRIGFRPRELPTPASIGSPLEIVMERIPPMLNTVHVNDNELCPGSADRGARRIITGSRGEYYYTGDHYEHFVRVDITQ